MASGPHIDNHLNALPFVQEELPAQPPGVFTVSWTADGRTAAVSGVCPACGAWTRMEFSPGRGGTKGLVGRLLSREAPAPLQLTSPLTLYCECGHVHAGRSSENADFGCGRFWKVSLSEDQQRSPGPTAAAP